MDGESRDPISERPRDDPLHLHHQRQGAVGQVPGVRQDHPGRQGDTGGQGKQERLHTAGGARHGEEPGGAEEGGGGEAARAQEEEEAGEAGGETPADGREH